jgi:hypothetical protein
VLLTLALGGAVKRGSGAPGRTMGQGA